jgi:hypothetical protein
MQLNLFQFDQDHIYSFIPNVGLSPFAYYYQLVIVMSFFLCRSEGIKSTLQDCLKLSDWLPT